MLGGPAEGKRNPDMDGVLTRPPRRVSVGGGAGREWDSGGKGKGMLQKLFAAGKLADHLKELQTQAEVEAKTITADRLSRDSMDVTNQVAEQIAEKYRREAPRLVEPGSTELPHVEGEEVAFRVDVAGSHSLLNFDPDITKLSNVVLLTTLPTEIEWMGGPLLIFAYRRPTNDEQQKALVQKYEEHRAFIKAKLDAMAAQVKEHNNTLRGKIEPILRCTKETWQDEKETARKIAEELTRQRGEKHTTY